MEIDPRDNYKTEKRTNLEAFLLIAGFNQNILTEHEKDVLDQWITEDDCNMRLFEIFSDTDYKRSLKVIYKSL